MKSPVPIFLLLLAILTTCTWFLVSRNTAAKPKQELTLYCAAGLRKPVSEIAARYEAQTGCKVNLIFNGSGALLSQLQLAGGDLYLPATSDYVKLAEHKGLVSEIYASSSMDMTAVLVVRKDEDRIQNFNDIKKDGIKLSFAVPDAAIGNFTRQVLLQAGEWSAIEKNITVLKPTVNNTVEDVSLGSVDATIAWDAVALQHPDLKIIPIPLFADKAQGTAIAVLKSTKDNSEARTFAYYLTNAVDSIETFQKYGYGAYINH